MMFVRGLKGSRRTLLANCQSLWESWPDMPRKPHEKRKKTAWNSGENCSGGVRIYA